jgi:cytochrome o ubiquinol oxidase subunit IV
MSRIEIRTATKIIESHGTVLSYTVGFVLSVLLTLAAYMSVVNKLFVGRTLIVFVVSLAVVQLLVQLLFFLHLGRETKPRWNLVIFLFMLLVVGIIVSGSLWIMYNLDYNMMPEHQPDLNTYLKEHEGI